MQPGHQRAGGLPGEVDGHVAAQHQIDPLPGGERWRLGDQIVVPELHQLAYVRAHLVAAADRRQEEAREVPGRGHLHRAWAVTGGARRREGLLTQIGGDDLHVPATARRQQLAQHHRGRVGLLPGRAPRAPDPQPPGAGRSLHQLRQHVLAQCPHLRRVSEEMRLLDGHLVQQPLAFGGLVEQEQVRRDIGRAGRPEPLGDAGAEGLATALVEHQTGGGGQQGAQLGELPVRQGGHGRPSSASTAGATSCTPTCRSTAPSAKAACGMP